MIIHDGSSVCVGDMCPVKCRGFVIHVTKQRLFVTFQAASTATGSHKLNADRIRYTTSGSSLWILQYEERSHNMLYIRRLMLTLVHEA